MNPVEEFRVDFVNRVRATAALGDIPLASFVSEVVQVLIEAEELSDWTPCFFRDKGYRKRDLIVDGFLIDDMDVDSSITLVVGYFDGATEGIPSITMSQASSLLDKALNFVEDAVAGRLHDELEPSRPETDLATWLYSHGANVGVVRVYLMTDAALAARNKELPEKRIGNTRVDLHVWDIERLYRIQETGGREPIEIDLENFMPGGLPAIRASLENSDYHAYLCSVPGSLLADLYDRYGARLLEGNVRSFLSVKGGVNKGIRKTIMTEPTRFFAYNNGVAATATDVSVVGKENSTRIVRLKDLQIVNGGQTTASLFTTRRNDRVALDSIFVPLKLSVVTEGQAAEIIPLISRYANSQNKVSEADFFANHPLHRRLEEFSRRLWAPQARGATYATRWFYERARGQYVNEQAKLTKAKKASFLLEHPKDQLITKTDLAKYENAWAQLPHVVSLGAQKNFAKFADRIAPEWDQDETRFNELWFKRLVGKAILFKETERVVSAAPWYQGGYRANIVAYAVSLFSVLVSRAGGNLDFELLWKSQSCPPVISKQMELLAHTVFDVIVNPPSELSNVTEWCKKEACWKRVAELRAILQADILELLADKQEERKKQKDARGQQKEDDIIALVAAIISKPPGYWKRAQEWESSKHILSVTQKGVLDLIAARRSFIPSDKQAAVLREAERKLQEEGFQ